MIRTRFLQKCLTLSISLLAVIVVVAGCGAPPSQEASTRTEHVFPKPVTDSNGMELVWGSDVKRAALNLIRHSKQDVYLDMYELSDPDIIAALDAAHQRGVDVRVVLDKTEKHSTETGYPDLRKDGVPVRQLSIKHGIDHLKMLVTDQGVLIGGMNFGSQSWANNDASVVIQHPNASFKALFLWDFRRAGGEAAEAPTAALPLVYDRAIQPAVLSAIQKAKKTIQMEAFDLSDRQVIDALQAAAERGVAEVILVDPTETYSRKAVSTLRDAGAMVRYYRPYHGELMHAKIIDVDHGATFIIGSANFSHQAYTYNHEADVVLHDVHAFDRSFRKNLQTEMGRGSDYPLKEKHSSWN